MRQNPCRYCAVSMLYKGGHGPTWTPECRNCEKRKKHQEYLQKKRKFEKGEVITSVEDLLKQEWVMLGESTRHIEVLKSMPLRVVLMFLNGNKIYKAMRKESEEK